MGINYIDNLPIDRWEEYKNLKIEAIKAEPIAFSFELSDVIKVSEEEWKKDLENALKGETILVFAEDNGRLIGYGGVYIYTGKRFKHNAALEMLYVMPEYRGRGIAKTIVEKRVDWIIKRGGIKNIMCEVYSSQVPSIELHKKLGFEILGYMKDFKQTDNGYVDNVLMQKQL